MTPGLSASPTPSGSSSIADRIHKKFDKKLRHKGIIIDNDGDSDTTDSGHHDDVVPEQVIPIVAVVMMSVFGAPVLIVGLLLYFGFSRNRMMHKTVRMMVEKGQPVPAALLNPPPHVRKRSDMRRGVILMMIGLGLALFFGAVNDWENGAWTIGMIFFLIGVGYLLVWKLEGRGDAEAKADNPPPLP
jgi:hypothetical protein